MKILVLGAGRMGYGAAYDLTHNSPDVESITVADFDLKKAEDVAEKVGASRVTARQIDVSNYTDVVDLIRGHDSVISCVNYWYNEPLSRAAIETKANFCDLGGNNYVVDVQLALDADAKAAGINIIPDCGLAPGMVSILAMHGAAKFDELEEIHIRVGGLPQDPQPPLNYQLVFSVEGLINEYIETARVIRAGKLQTVESMTEIESLEFEGFPPLEAFQTSGGTSTLPETFLGKIRELDYKTIRYAGHCEKFKTMIDLGLCSSDEIVADYRSPRVSKGVTETTNHQKITPRKFFGELLQKHLPADGPDYVLIRLEFVGRRVSSPHDEGRSPHDGRSLHVSKGVTDQPDDERISDDDDRSLHVSKGVTDQFADDHVSDDDGRSLHVSKGVTDQSNDERFSLRYDIVDKQDETTGLSAMMRTTAFPASIIAQMMARGDVLTRGAKPQEKTIDPEKFVAELEKRNVKISIMEF